MEHTIGSLGMEIRCHVNPYANLSQRALQRCQVNMLKAMIPDLEGPDNSIPRGAKDLGDGYILLRARDRTMCQVDVAESQALRRYLQSTHNKDLPEGWAPKVLQWAWLGLPNGQVAQSAWKEKLKQLERVRMARNILASHVTVCTLVLGWQKSQNLGKNSGGCHWHIWWSSVLLLPWVAGYIWTNPHNGFSILPS